MSYFRYLISFLFYFSCFLPINVKAFIVQGLALKDEKRKVILLGDHHEQCDSSTSQTNFIIDSLSKYIKKEIPNLKKNKILYENQDLSLVSYKDLKSIDIESNILLFLDNVNNDLIKGFDNRNEFLKLSCIIDAKENLLKKARLEKFILRIEEALLNQSENKKSIFLSIMEDLKSDPSFKQDIKFILKNLQKDNLELASNLLKNNILHNMKSSVEQLTNIDLAYYLEDFNESQNFNEIEPSVCQKLLTDRVNSEIKKFDQNINIYLSSYPEAIHKCRQRLNESMNYLKEIEKCPSPMNLMIATGSLPDINCVFKILSDDSNFIVIAGAQHTSNIAQILLLCGFELIENSKQIISENVIDPVASDFHSWEMANLPISDFKPINNDFLKRILN